jgi:hypothetical protein
MQMKPVVVFVDTFFSYLIGDSAQSIQAIPTHDMHKTIGVL